MTPETPTPMLLPLPGTRWLHRLVEFAIRKTVPPGWVYMLWYGTGTRSIGYGRDRFSTWTPLKERLCLKRCGTYEEAFKVWGWKMLKLDQTLNVE